MGKTVYRIPYLPADIPLIMVWLQFSSMKMLIMSKERWYNHEHPVRPAVQSGDVRYYNEFEGIYEIDAHGQDVDVTFGSPDYHYDREIFARIWNLAGKGGVRCESQR